MAFTLAISLALSTPQLSNDKDWKPSLPSAQLGTFVLSDLLKLAGVL